MYSKNNSSNILQIIQEVILPKLLEIITSSKSSNLEKFRAIKIVLNIYSLMFR
jgi:hypothetical protein